MATTCDLGCSWGFPDQGNDERRDFSYGVNSHSPVGKKLNDAETLTSAVHENRALLALVPSLPPPPPPHSLHKRAVAEFRHACQMLGSNTLCHHKVREVLRLAFGANMYCLSDHKRDEFVPHLLYFLSRYADPRSMDEKMVSNIARLVEASMNTAEVPPNPNSLASISDAAELAHDSRRESGRRDERVEHSEALRLLQEVFGAEQMSMLSTVALSSHQMQVMSPGYYRKTDRVGSIDGAGFCLFAQRLYLRMRVFGIQPQSEWYPCRNSDCA